MTFKSTTFAVFIIAAVKAFEHPAPCVIKKSGQRNELIKTVLLWALLFTDLME